MPEENGVRSEIKPLSARASRRRTPDAAPSRTQVWLDAFEDIRFEPEELLDMGDKVLVTAQQKGHGSGSGVGVSQTLFQLYTIRRGLVIRQEDFLDRAEALRSAGLRD
jgi:ketosteroid isomerase-like protein